METVTVLVSILNFLRLYSVLWRWSEWQCYPTTCSQEFKDQHFHVKSMIWFWRSDPINFSILIRKCQNRCFRYCLRYLFPKVSRNYIATNNWQSNSRHKRFIGTTLVLTNSTVTSINVTFVKLFTTYKNIWQHRRIAITVGLIIAITKDCIAQLQFF